MRYPRCVKSTPWLVVVLGAVLVLGHVCELPALVDLVGHATGSTHHQHQADHHPGDSEIACDAVEATNTPSIEVAGAPAMAIGSLGGLVPPSRIGRTARESITPPPRPPLFLLHRSLLI